MLYQKKKLKNGLKVIVSPIKNTKTVTLLVLLGVGSRCETKKLNGISHFLEHLVFKGTKSRPSPGQIFKELDRVGATYNAFTSKENTGFWVKTSSADFDLGLDIISDILLHPLLYAEEIEKERGVILQEINMYEDDPKRRVSDILENIIYGDKPIGRDVIGTRETVRGIKREEVVSYKNRHYRGGSIVVAVAGDIDPRPANKKISKIFSQISPGATRRGELVKLSGKASRARFIEKDLDQTHLALAFDGYDMFDERRYALNVLSVILGGNSSSRLFMEIREKLGLAYYVYAYNNYYTDSGYLGIHAGIPHEKREDVIKKIMAILKSVKEKGVSQNELKEAKGYLRGQISLHLETTDDIASYLASQELFYKKIITPEETIKRIEKVTNRDILKVAKDVLNPRGGSVVAIGRGGGGKSGRGNYRSLLNLL